MIRFDYLLDQKEDLRLSYLLAKPFPYLVIDHICDQEKVEALYKGIPDLHNKSRDYVFASNKFEKSKFWTISKELRELYNDLISESFAEFLCFITNESVFVDEKFHGGGLHQGKEGSFLDMHIDFNYHPINKLWFRNLNILMYFNKDWKEEYGGHLKIKDLRTGQKKEIGVPFNRMIIQQTRNFTLHGYDTIHFPPETYRTSLAAYAYTIHQQYIEKPNTTRWHVKSNQPIKKILAKIYNPAVKIKNSLFGSGTAKN